MVFTYKHIVNKPADLVIESLQGLCTVNGHILSLDVPHKGGAIRLDYMNPYIQTVVHQRTQDKSRVALICGGGSGHEPAHAGFVGKGMLTAAVCGNVFASPNAGQVKRALEIVDNPKGTLIVVKNYTGDVLSFGLAREQYLAQHPDKQDLVKFIVVGDDVAVGKTQGAIVGRRGLAGTVLVYKLAGALAELGGSLAEVHDLATWTSARLATIGCGLEHCHVPGTTHSESSIKENEIEIGLGIHNEPGAKSISPIPTRKDLLESLVELLTSNNDPERSFVQFTGDGNDRVVLMVNNLGGLSELELGGIANEAITALRSRRITIRRVLVGTYMTSLNMPGFSLTLLLLPNDSTGAGHTSEADILALLAMNAETPGWKPIPTLPPKLDTDFIPFTSPTFESIVPPGPSTPAEDYEEFESAVRRACEALIQGEPEITRLDSIVGDGDCGLTLKSGAEGVLAELDNGVISGDDVLKSMLAISKVAEEQMGGTSGALYSIFFSALAQYISKFSSDEVLSRAAWTVSLTAALDSLYTYTRARPPSRTLVDPLDAFVKAIQSGNSLQGATKAAARAADATSKIKAATAGRSAYVEGKHLKGIADPGALGVKLILEAIAHE